jgi:hypothetical protein
MAPGLSGRPADEISFPEDISLSIGALGAPFLLAMDVRWTRSGSCSLLAMGAEACDLEHG